MELLDEITVPFKNLNSFSDTLVGIYLPKRYPKSRTSMHRRGEIDGNAINLTDNNTLGSRITPQHFDNIVVGVKQPPFHDAPPERVRSDLSSSTEETMARAIQRALLKMLLRISAFSSNNTLSCVIRGDDVRAASPDNNTLYSNRTP